MGGEAGRAPSGGLRSCACSCTGWGRHHHIILNENEATRIPTNGRSTSPDNSLASNDIALLSDWTVSTSLASDHLPILITIISEQSTIDGPQRTYINFKKADRVRYAEACDEYLAEAGETRTVEQTENTFRKAVNMASGLFFPAVRIRHFQQTLPASTKSLADERDRKLNPADEALNDLNKQIQLLWWKTSEPNGNPPSTNATIEYMRPSNKAYRIYVGLLRA